MFTGNTYSDMRYIPYAAYVEEYSLGDLLIASGRIFPSRIELRDGIFTVLFCTYSTQLK